jgi:PAS domain S-box-containing protein
MPPDGSRGDPPDEARARSELRFRAIIDGFADPIVGVDGYHLIRYANAAVGRVLGYRAADLLARPIGALVHPDDREAVEAKLAAALSAHGTDSILEHRVRRADGAWELVETTPNTLEDPTGRPVLVLHLRCVTERRKLEAQLHRRQKMEAVGRWRAASPTTSTTCSR